MELGFNIAWLALALALSIGWARNVSDARYHRSLFALMLLVMLLFPVISITDDIHQDHSNSATGEEIKYKDDLQHRLDLGRLHTDFAPSDVVLPASLPAISLSTLAFERSHLQHHTPVSQPGFPPTVFDLPPPQLG